MKPIRVHIITLSDKACEGLREDLTGPMLRKMLAAEMLDGEPLFEICGSGLLPDDERALSAVLISLCDSGGLDLILTNGGTGLSPRDRTPEATLAAAERRVPGLAEGMRLASMKITPKAMLSRGEAVIRKQTLIVNLPGSPKAARENLEAILPVLPHGIEVLRGEAYECGRPERPAR